MKVEKTLTITVAGVLTVIVDPRPSEGYVGERFLIAVAWTPISGHACDINIDYGDGTSDYARTTLPRSFPHTYEAAGTYTITVTVEDTYTRATGTGSASVTVKPPLAITFTADKTSGDVPLTVTFTCGASGGYLPYDWTLDFGDGTPPESGTRTVEGTWTVTHTYETIGTYTAKLTVIDALGESLSSEISLYAGVAPPVIPAELAWIIAPEVIGLLTAYLSQAL